MTNDTVEGLVEEVWNKRPAITASNIEVTLVSKDELRVAFNSLLQSERGAIVEVLEGMKVSEESDLHDVTFEEKLHNKALDHAINTIKQRV